MFTQYEDVVDYLYHALPAYQKVGGIALKIDLSNILKLCEALGNPHLQFKSVHIAGTNGKGSVSHMMAAACISAGYRTGLYTSPHYLDFRERIRVGPSMISKDQVINFVNENRPLFEDVRPSFFEMTVAMAYSHFANEKVDVAIVETGLGGRLDSTNIINPLLSIITNVDLDHMDYLGSTLPLISREKAGIIKPHVPSLLGRSHPEVLPIIQEHAAANESPFSIASEKVNVTVTEKTSNIQHCRVSIKSKPCRDFSLALPLRGSYQIENLTTAVAGLGILSSFFPRIDDKNLVGGIQDVIELTDIKGRFQSVRQKPNIIVDGGHNLAGMQQVLETVADLTFTNLHIILGFSKGKDIAKIVQLLPAEAAYYLCEANLPRAMPVELLEEAIKTRPVLRHTLSPSVLEAIVTAQWSANADDLILVTGSIFVVAEALEHLTD